MIYLLLVILKLQNENHVYPFVILVRVVMVGSYSLIFHFILGNYYFFIH
jgi:hypothetical protein